MKARSYRYLLLPLVLAALAIVCTAQDENDDDSDNSAGNYLSNARLSLTFDKQGNTNVNLMLPMPPESWDRLRGAMGQALHCPLANLHNPQSPVSQLTANKLPPAQRERYLKDMTEFGARFLEGRCPEALSRQAAVMQGDIDYGPLVTKLNGMGVQQLSLEISVPQTPHLAYSHSYLSREPSHDIPYLLYQIPMQPEPKPIVLHLEYGFSRNDLYRAFATLGGFILAPFAFVLWIRRKALMTGRTDATAAWFGFFRMLNWVLTGSMLLWITSGLGARPLLQNWIRTIDLPLWQSVVVDVTILTGPAFLVYFLCTAISYPVYAQMKAGGWSRREFLAQQLVAIGTQALPLMLLLAALQMLRQKLQIAVTLLILSYLALLVFRHLNLRISRSVPEALTQGELRDRVFELAKKMGVKLTQIFILPAGKGQVANAFASSKNLLIFTDYLLQHLTRREVDAVAAHELAHLEHKHPGKLAALFYASIFLPWYFPLISGLLTSAITMPLAWLRVARHGAQLWTLRVYTGMAAFNEWQQRDFILILLGLTVFYFFSRRFENQADKTAARTIADPEAQITGLLKISRLNLMPIRFGKASEKWLTHPSTQKRIERIAVAGGMSPEHLREILESYSAGDRPGGQCFSHEIAGDDHYPVPPAKDSDRMRSAASNSMWTQVRLWILLIAHVIPAALVWVLIQKLRLLQNPWAGWSLGVVISIFAVMASGKSVGRAKQRRIRNQLKQALEREGVPAGREGDVFVGFAPSNYPRFYTTGYYSAAGFLKLTRDRLLFVGEKTRFALDPEEIEEIAPGPGSPGWWNIQVVYVRWKPGSTGESRIMHFYLLDRHSLWRQRAAVRELYRRLQSWRLQRQSAPPLPQELATIPALAIRKVTCTSPRHFAGVRAQFKVLVKLLPLAVGVAILFHADVFYVCGVSIAIRIFEFIPYWRYRDKPVFALKPEVKVASSGIQAPVPANSDAEAIS